MTGYSHAANERLRRNSLDDRMEAIWAAAHPGCDGWQYVPEEARLICSCGEVIATEGQWGGSDA